MKTLTLTHPGLRGHHPPRIPLRFRPRRHPRRTALLATLLMAAATATTWQLWPETHAPTATTAPAWFAPIADYYGHNPAITPRLDFASLYAGYPPWFAPIAAYYGHKPAITPSFDFTSLYAAPA